MKRVLSLLLILAAPLAQAQTAPSAPSQQELLENVNILKGRVDDLSDARSALEKQVRDLQAKVDELSAKLAKPPVNYATQDDFKSLKAAIEDVDKKRQADNDHVVAALNDIKDIAKGARAPLTAPTHPSTHTDNTPTPASTAVPEGPGFNYDVQPNDTLVKITRKLYKEQHIKVSVDEVLKANPSLKGDAKNLKEGDKLFIPAPKAADGTDAK